MQRNWIHILGMLITWAVWIWLASAALTSLGYILIAVLGILLLIPLLIVGRWLLDREPTIERAYAMTTWIHYLVAIFLGSAVLAATRFSLYVPVLPLTLPPVIGLVVMFASSLILLLVILNLLLKGLGAPFAISFTRMVATEWFYAWTRNPMILAGLVLLLGLGIWLQSGLFLLWLLILVIPAVMVFIKVYEERELEIRFGQTYLDYKTRTPAFIPRRPM